MKKRKGVVVPYEGPEKMYEERIKKLTVDAEFALKFVSPQDLIGFEIAVVFKEKETGETYIVRRQIDEHAED